MSTNPAETAQHDSPELELLERLIRRPSVTPDDAGCQELMATELAALGFDCEHMPFGDVSNLWARRGTDGPLLCFAGHTDVVPPGDESGWDSDPFEPIIRDGEIVSYVTSANYGHTLGGAIGMGDVPSKGETAEQLLSSSYEIEIAGNRVAAEASLRPMYDPKSERVKV